MAISTPTLATSAVAGTTASTLATPSFSPTGNSLLIVFATMALAAAATRFPVSLSDTFSPAITWNSIDAVEQQNATSVQTRAIAAWWTIVGSSPGSGVLTATWTGNSVRRSIQVIEIASGYHSTVPIRQDKSEVTLTSPLTVTYDSTLLTPSLSLAGWCANGGTTSTPDSDYTELSDITGGSGHTAEIQYKLGSADTTIVFTVVGTPNAMAAIAVEVQEPAAGGGGIILPVLNLGDIHSAIFGGQVMR